MHPLLEELRAQRRGSAIIAPPPSPIITDRRNAWRKRWAWHQATVQHHPLRIWKA